MSVLGKVQLQVAPAPAQEAPRVMWGAAGAGGSVPSIRILAYLSVLHSTVPLPPRKEEPKQAVSVNSKGRFSPCLDSEVFFFPLVPFFPDPFIHAYFLVSLLLRFQVLQLQKSWANKIGELVIVTLSSHLKATSLFTAGLSTRGIIVQTHMILHLPSCPRTQWTSQITKRRYIQTCAASQPSCPRPVTQPFKTGSQVAPVEAPRGRSSPDLNPRPSIDVISLQPLILPLLLNPHPSTPCRPRRPNALRIERSRAKHPIHITTHQHHFT